MIIDKWKARIAQTPVHTMLFPFPALSKERPRSGRGGHMYTPKRTREYEKKVASTALKYFTEPLSCPVEIQIMITVKVPKSWNKQKRELAKAGLIVPTKGDLDNKVKALTDGMNGIVYIDDIQIAGIKASQRYGLVDETRINIKQLALSQSQIDQAVYAMKANNGQRTDDTSGT